MAILQIQLNFVINKIGHAMHDIDPVFSDFVHRKDLE